MLSFFRDHAGSIPQPLAAEQASWMVVAAAELLAEQQSDPMERARYAEVARRMRHAACRRWDDEATLRAASPIIVEADGRSCTMVEAVSRFRDDPDAGVRAAMAGFSVFEWRPAA